MYALLSPACCSASASASSMASSPACFTFWFTPFSLFQICCGSPRASSWCPTNCRRPPATGCRGIPILVGVEWMRSAFYEGYGLGELLDKQYLLGFAAVSIFIGLLMERTMRGSIIMQPSATASMLRRFPCEYSQHCSGSRGDRGGAVSALGGRERHDDVKLRLTPASGAEATGRGTPAVAVDPRAPPASVAAVRRQILRRRAGRARRLARRARSARPLSARGRRGAGSRRIPLFDPAFYAERNPDVVAAGVNLLQHYLENGHREGRDPHPLVDLKLIQLAARARFRRRSAPRLSAIARPELKPHRLVDPAFSPPSSGASTRATTAPR